MGRLIAALGRLGKGMSTRESVVAEEGKVEDVIMGGIGAETGTGTGTGSQVGGSRTGTPLPAAVEEKGGKGGGGKKKKGKSGKR